MIKIILSTFFCKSINKKQIFTASTPTVNMILIQQSI